MKKCIVHLTEKERKEKEREMLSRRGNEIPRGGREIFGRDSIMSSNGYFTLHHRDVNDRRRAGEHR